MSSTSVPGTARPLTAGLAAGAAAWLAGYALTYLLVAPEIRESTLARVVELFGDGEATPELVGWVFFDAHLVDVVVDAGVLGTETLDLVGGEGGVALLLYAVPPGLLVAAGVAVVRALGRVDPADGAVVGAAVAAGYLPLCAVGAVLARVEAAGAVGQPDLLPAVVVAGLLYPAVFGALGGAVAAATAGPVSPP